MRSLTPLFLLMLALPTLAAICWLERSGELDEFDDVTELATTKAVDG